jgi:hypothetical protein
MIYQFTKRMLKETDKRLLWKLAFNFGYKGMRSVQKFKKRLKSGIHFPPFLFISIINSCQLRCQGCWVDVEAPRKMIDLDQWNKLINDAKKHGNAYFGILGGASGLLFSGVYQWADDHGRGGGAAAGAGERDAAGQHRGVRANQ